MRAQVDFQKSSNNRSFVRKRSNKKRRKETKTDVPELDFISKVCTGPGPGGKGNEKGTPDDQKANQLAGKGTNVSAIPYLLPFSLQAGGLSRLDEGWQGKTRTT